MANKVYHATETEIVFKSSGGDATFTPTSLADSAGRISAQYDRGTGSKPQLYKWYAIFKATSTLTVGTRLEIYLATARTGANTVITGNQSTSDAALSSTDKLHNFQPVGAVVADTATGTDQFVGSGLVEIRDRYVSVIWHNKLGQALSATAGDHSFVLVPVPDEIQ